METIQNKYQLRLGLHNVPLATLGTFFLWFGWFGFNGGSLLRASSDIGLVIVNTNMAAASAGVSALIFNYATERPEPFTRKKSY